MSILKDSLKETLFSKPMALLIGMALIFFFIVFYFFGYVINYKETVVSKEKVEIHVLKAKSQSVKDKYNVYYRYKDNDTTYFIKVDNCTIKPKLNDSLIQAERIHYSYETLFRSGSDSRLDSPSNLFCVKK
jgi:hypothetical protein